MSAWVIHTQKLTMSVPNPFGILDVRGEDVEKLLPTISVGDEICWKSEIGSSPQYRVMQVKPSVVVQEMGTQRQYMWSPRWRSWVSMYPTVFDEEKELKDIVDILMRSIGYHV